MKSVTLLAIVFDNGGHQKNGIICSPDHLPPIPAWDMCPAYSKFFHTVTSNPGRNAVVMGRNTYSCLNPSPLPFRLNAVVSASSAHSGLKLPLGALSFASLADAVQGLKTIANCDQIFIVGGAQIFKEALAMGLCDRLLIAHVTDTESSHKNGMSSFQCPTNLPSLENWTRSRVVDTTQSQIAFFEYAAREKSPAPCIRDAVYPDHFEHQYLDLARRIIVNGVQREDRTGYGTLSLFGERMRFDLQGGATFPLLTTKRVFWRGVVEELLWFISGSTDSTALSRRGVHIWDKNGSREFLDTTGFTSRRTGDLGPVYGFQWRHFGATYTDADASYNGLGVDQLKNVIKLIRTDPTSRRIIMCAWNPVDVPFMALPPCHVLAQFHVHNKELSCQVYQRSADVGLGVPFNMASYALLTCMLAHVCDLRAKELIHVIGDAHIYRNHIEEIREQLTRPLRRPPTLTIRSNATEIEDMTINDLVLDGYDPHPALRMQMAV